jgi:hypothetical protein
MKRQEAAPETNGKQEATFDEARRRFLEKFGKGALAAPAVTLLVSTVMSPAAYAHFGSGPTPCVNKCGSYPKHYDFDFFDRHHWHR